MPVWQKSSGLTADEKATMSALADLTGSVTKATVSGNMADMAQVIRLDIL